MNFHPSARFAFSGHTQPVAVTPNGEGYVNPEHNTSPFVYPFAIAQLAGLSAASCVLSSLLVLLKGCERETGIDGNPLCTAHLQPRQSQTAAPGRQVWQVCCSVFGGKLPPA